MKKYKLPKDTEEIMIKNEVVFAKIIELLRDESSPYGYSVIINWKELKSND